MPVAPSTSSSSGTVKLSIFVVGKSKSGKSAIVNFLTDMSDSLSKDYTPTQGVRILEFKGQVAMEKPTHQDLDVLVELWDCSGNEKFQSVWPSVAKYAHSVIFVQPHDSKDETALESWNAYFTHLTPERKLVFSHQPDLADGSAATRKPSKTALKGLAKSRLVASSIEARGAAMRQEFERLIVDTCSAMAAEKLAEENELLQRVAT